MAGMSRTAPEDRGGDLSRDVANRLLGAVFRDMANFLQPAGRGLLALLRWRKRAWGCTFSRLPLGERGRG